MLRKAYLTGIACIVVVTLFTIPAKARLISVLEQTAATEIVVEESGSQAVEATLERLELQPVSDWLCVDSLNVNIDKTGLEEAEYFRNVLLRGHVESFFGTEARLGTGNEVILTGAAARDYRLMLYGLGGSPLGGQ